MPGVKITTSASSGPSMAEVDASGQVFIVGFAERGPIGKATLIRGFADFEARFGSRVSYSYLWDVVKTFFDEGGKQAFISRVVGPAAKTGTASVTAQGGTSALYTVTSSSPGAWSSNVSLVVGDGAIENTVSATITLNGKPVESWSNIATRAEFESRLKASGFVTLANLGATGETLPTKGTYTLTAGTDDRAAVTSADHAKALDVFSEGLGDGSVLAADTTAINTELTNHAIANNRIALLYAADPLADIKSLPTAMPDSDAAGMFFPWVQVSDTAGNVRNVPPVGYVAAVRNRAHEQVGAWRAPAGEIASAYTLVGVSKEFSRAEGDALDASRVSVIRRIGSGVRLYGWRSLSSDQQNFGFLNARDLLNRVVVESSKRLEQFVFAPIDAKGQLLANINAELVGILEPLRLAGGLYPRIDASGKEVDEGYLVDTSTAVNTLTSLSKNEVRARVAMRVSPIGALVTLDIVKVGLMSGLS